MYIQACCFLFMVILCDNDVGANIIRLTPTQVYVKENSSAILTCSNTSGALIESRWQHSQSTKSANLLILNGECKRTEFLLDSDIFDGVCNGNGTYSVVLKRIDRTQHGDEWTCRVTDMLLSNKVVIHVSVPATSVTLSQPDKGYVMENQEDNITCITSASRPDPRVQWYLNNSMTGAVYNLTQFSTYTYFDREYGLRASNSTLKFKQNRTVNGLSLYCKIWTQSDSADITSREIVVNVTYPPYNYPKIQGDESNVIEADTGTFVCSVTGGNPLALLRWNCFGRDGSTFETNGSTVTSTIKWTALRGYNTCSCQADHLNDWKRITNVTINVLYPPAKPRFTIGSTIVYDDVRIIRNNTLRVICKSESNPSSNYAWTGPDISSKDSDTLEITNVKMIDEGLYKCNASNRMTRSNNSYIDRSNSSSFNLIMLYPPNTPNFRFGNNTGKPITSDIINVVKKDTFTIYCDAKGNPVPNVTWDNNDISPTLSISSILSDTKRTCTATNVMEETENKTRTNATSSASLSFNVLYPPGLPTINVSNFKGETVNGQGTTVSLIELETVYLTCISKSKPLPTYKWVHDRSSETGRENKVIFQNITRKKNGTYTCNVENVMDRSNGTTQEGANKSEITFNILYPAFVVNIKNRSVLEGSQFKKECPVIHGNPPNSTVVWSRIIDQNRWNNKLLYIRNVSRTDDSDYSCSVITEMFPTLGSSLKIENKQTFHLNVFFRSEIRSFSLNNSRPEKIVVINETENAPIVCLAEANPQSNLTILNPKGDLLSAVSNSNVANYTLQNTSYENAGEYTCTGRNNYSRDSPASSNLIIIVRCPPRPSSGDTSVMKVATVLHVNVTLQFSAWNYLDEPNKTEFNWLKENVPISYNGSKYIIRTDGLQTNFSIKNTTQHDLGFYQVNVKNSAGEYTHNYHLKATDKPDPPIDFKVVNDSITDDSVTLTWSPGFNGGFQQTFVILYKMKFDMAWLNKSIKDTENKNMNYTLYDLTSMQEYEIEMFAKNREGMSAKTYRLKFKTGALLENQVESETTDNSSIIAGSVSAFVVIVAATVIGVVFVLRKRQNSKSDGLYQNVPFIGKANAHKPKLDTEVQKKKEYSSKTEETTFKGNSSDGKRKLTQRNVNYSKSDETGVESLQEVDDVPIFMNERTEYCNSKNEIDKIKRITVAELYAYVFGNEDDLEVEYQKLPTGLQKPCTFARRPENISLNRYNGIYPYDHTRVKIPEQPDFFINACYIDGYKKKKAYIASLGPTSKTTSDFKTFWQMIWNERSDLIIMLTNLHELSGMKCEQYWPDEGTELQYGDVLVTSKTTEVYAEYTVRTFEISKGNNQRSLTHLHYTAWPDKTVPEDVTSLLEFRRRMKDVPSTHNGPAVVHCSAGIGRTGTLIALDILIEEGLDVGSVNVFECVKSLRDQRVKMVQTLEQYVYIHKALVNSFSFDCETFTRKSIQHEPDIKNDQHYSKLFKQLNLSLETNSATEQKERTKNTKYSIKNRQGADIPGDRFRVFLNHTDGREGSDYINAVYVNSFKRKDHFITAQSPLPNNVTDFISMIYHGDCSCIATMEDLKEPGMAVGAYLSEKKKTITFGNFEVTCSRFEENSTYVIRKMKIKYTGEIYSGEKCFYHFQFTKWMTGNKTPGDVEDFVQFVQAVAEYADELGEDRSRVVVHCLKANERSCLFCALAIIMEKLKVEGSVNILNVVRHLRTRRRSAIVSKEQLKFCYEAASAYAKRNKL